MPKAGKGGSGRDRLTQSQTKMLLEFAQRANLSQSGAGGTAGDEAKPFDEPITPFEHFLNHMFREGGMIRRAPFSFASAVIVVGIGIWYVIDWSYSHQIAALQDQVQMLQIRLDQTLDQITQLRADQKQQR